MVVVRELAAEELNHIYPPDYLTSKYVKLYEEI